MAQACGLSQMRPSLVLAGAEHHVVVGDAAREPVAVPQVFVGGAVDGARAGAEVLRAFGQRGTGAGGFANLGPQVERVGGGHGQPARHAAAFVADHVHRVAPVALGDVAEATLVARLQQPVHGAAHALGDGEGDAALRADHVFVEDVVIAGFIEVDLERHRQPHAVVGVRHLVDVFEFRAFGQQDPVRHGAAGFLLRQRVQEGFAHHAGLDEAHAHIVLQVVAGLRIGAQAIDVAVVEHLARQPVVDEVVEVRVRRFDAQASRPPAM
jgi:hypothetical protein